MEIRPAAADDFEEALSLLGESFARDNPLLAALGVTAADYKRRLADPLALNIAQGLSLLAQDGGVTVGGLIACDFSKQAAVGQRSDERFAPLEALLSQLEQEYRRHRDVGPGESMLVDMAAVSPGARGHGIYGRLRERAHLVGQDAGFAWVVGELSSPATQHVCVDTFGHEVVAEIQFDSFDFDGLLPFASITAPPSNPTGRGTALICA